MGLFWVRQAAHTSQPAWWCIGWQYLACLLGEYAPLRYTRWGPTRQHSETDTGAANELQSKRGGAFSAGGGRGEPLSVIEAVCLSQCSTQAAI